MAACHRSAQCTSPVLFVNSCQIIEAHFKDWMVCWWYVLQSQVYYWSALVYVLIYHLRQSNHRWPPPDDHAHPAIHAFPLTAVGKALVRVNTTKKYLSKDSQSILLTSLYFVAAREYQPPKKNPVNFGYDNVIGIPKFNSVQHFKVCFCLATLQYTVWSPPQMCSGHQNTIPALHFLLPTTTTATIVLW